MAVVALVLNGTHQVVTNKHHDPIRASNSNEDVQSLSRTHSRGVMGLVLEPQRSVFLTPARTLFVCKSLPLLLGP